MSFIENPFSFTALVKLKQIHITVQIDQYLFKGNRINITYRLERSF